MSTFTFQASQPNQGPNHWVQQVYACVCRLLSGERIFLHLFIPQIFIGSSCVLSPLLPMALLQLTV